MDTIPSDIANESSQSRVSIKLLEIPQIVDIVFHETVADKLLQKAYQNILITFNQPFFMPKVTVLSNVKNIRLIFRAYVSPCILDHMIEKTCRMYRLMYITTVPEGCWPSKYIIRQ